MDFTYECQLTAIDDAFETIHGDSEFGLIQIQQISEELQSNCIRLINESKSQKDSSKVLFVFNYIHYSYLL